MNIVLYGIPNCDTVKKARAWLADQGVAYAFHDFKKGGVPPERLDAWLRSAGWEKLLNRQGSTWRKLDADTQLRSGNESGARSAGSCVHAWDTAISVPPRAPVRTHFSSKNDRFGPDERAEFAPSGARLRRIHL